MKVKVLQNILDANLQLAEKNRQFFEQRGILALNVMSSPGAGKTTLLVKAIERLGRELGIAVIEGDIASTIDADRIGATGAPVVQINTGGGCHLDAGMVAKALDSLDLTGTKLLFIENVGNLVCPAEFRLGERLRVVLLSVPEGDDKPQKYPLMFAEADAVVVNKIDMLPLTDFNMDSFRRAVTGLKPDVRLFELSARTGDGLDKWLDWLRGEVKKTS